MTSRFNPSGVAAPAPHYSHGVGVAAGLRTIHVSGQVGMSPSGAIPASVEDQLDIVWQNIEAVLAEGGFKLTDIVSVRGYLLDAAAVPAYRTRFKARLGDTRPASTLVVVKALVSPQLLAEIEVVAAA
ncbi:MAG: Rid family hydrolase [Hyphomonadaceae bacterium]|nr:Rid family hydrolase [Hyphomonadaceae bacterium]